jgi:hypothetical protein
MHSRELNNARICTKSPIDMQVDYAVPILQEADNAEYYREECSDSVNDVPWDVGDSHNPALSASGLMTSWPVNSLWPSLNTDDIVSLGLPKHLKSYSWSVSDTESSTGGMTTLLLCDTDEDCWTKPAHEDVRKEGLQFKCYNRVCVLQTAPAADWNKHGDIVFE